MLRLVDIDFQFIVMKLLNLNESKSSTRPQASLMLIALKSYTTYFLYIV